MCGKEKVLTIFTDFFFFNGRVELFYFFHFSLFIFVKKGATNCSHGLVSVSHDGNGIGRFLYQLKSESVCSLQDYNLRL